MIIDRLELTMIQQGLEDTAIFYRDISQANDNDYFKQRAEKVLALKNRIDGFLSTPINSANFLYTLKSDRGQS